MKQRWIILSIVLIVIIALIVYLAERNFLSDLKWETVAIIVAAFLGPVKMMFLWFNKDKDGKSDAEELTKENIRLKSELETTLQINNSLKVAGERANSLQKEIELLDANIELLAHKKA